MDGSKGYKIRMVAGDEGKGESIHRRILMIEFRGSKVEKMENKKWILFRTRMLGIS